MIVSVSHHKTGHHLLEPSELTKEDRMILADRFSLDYKILGDYYEIPKH